MKLLNKISTFAVILLIVSACTPTHTTVGQKTTVKTDVTKSSISNMRLPQSHFTFPNSNVIPIGTANGTASRIGDVDNFPDISGAISEAMDKAIASKGADLLINANVNGTLTTITTTTQSGYNFDISIEYKYDVVVQGTAARMTIGKQKLD